MKPCPKCGCAYHKLAFAIVPDATTVAVACMSCEHVGPGVRMTYPPSRATYALAADAWDDAISPFARPFAAVRQFVKRAALH